MISAFVGVLVSARYFELPAVQQTAQYSYPELQYAASYPELQRFASPVAYGTPPAAPTAAPGPAAPPLT